ncbi:MAG TPA: hypothetical protein DIU15_02635 [Deltaproteobacteria bacterium]|nr:hypothetical protein [Deltaproteobacteria bacterium]
MGADGALADSLRQSQLPLSVTVWVPAFCCAVRDLNRPLGNAVADGLDELLLGLDGVVDPERIPSFSDAEPPDLHAPDTDLECVVEWLSTPCHSGLFVSTAVIEQLARDFEVPRGFGNRRRVLRALLEGASRYGGLDKVLSLVSELAGRHRIRLETTYGSSPMLAQATGSWKDRLLATQDFLQEAIRLFVGGRSG